MTDSGRYTLSEIMSQPEVWALVLDAYEQRQEEVLVRWQQLRPGRVLFIGCGSTHYLSQTAAALFQSVTGIPSSAAPSSEIVFFPEMHLEVPQETLLIAVSRSGTTTETLQAVKQFRALGGRAVWAIGCYGESELVQISDFALVAEAAQEQSVAQTRSFTSMLLLVEALAATISGLGLSDLAKLPQLLRGLLEDTAVLISDLGQRLDLQRIFFLGSGFLYGIANEAMLKMKEMSLTNSEGFHFLEIRHGPMSMVNEEALVIGLIGDAGRAHEEKVLAEMQALGAITWGLNSNAESCCLHRTDFDSGIPAWALTGLYLPPLQLLSYVRAKAKGLDPDNPRHLTAVISLDTAAFANA
jgi:glucosamine--fructose-6-phosphate aminotransferase (isomerizing)